MSPNEQNQPKPFNDPEIKEKIFVSALIRLEEFDEHTFSFIMALIGQNKHLPSVELLHGLDGWKVFILGHYLVGGFYTGDLYTLIADLPELTLLAEQLNAHAKISGNLLSSVKAVIFKDFP